MAGQIIEPKKKKLFNPFSITNLFRIFSQKGLKTGISSSPQYPGIGILGSEAANVEDLRKSFGCCCTKNPCKDRPYWSGTSDGGDFWGVRELSPALQYISPESLEDLNEICIFAFGTGISNIALRTFDEATWAEWVNAGGILMMGAEYIPIFPEAERLGTNSLFSTIGSSIRMSPGNFAVGPGGSYACSGPHGYTGVINKAVNATRDLGATLYSGGATSVFRGGTPLFTAPPCEEPLNNKFGAPGGVSIVGELVGEGQVYMAGDSNYESFHISQAILDALDAGLSPL